MSRSLYSLSDISYPKDCTYEGERDGCKGGWYYQAWDYSAKAGRLATSAAAPYTEKDGRCSYSRKHNGLQVNLVYYIFSENQK